MSSSLHTITRAHHRQALSPLAPFHHAESCKRAECPGRGRNIGRRISEDIPGYFRVLVAAGGEEEDEGVIGGGQQQVRALDNQRESFRVVQLVLASVDGCNRSRVSFACNCVRWERSQGAQPAAGPYPALSLAVLALFRTDSTKSQPWTRSTLIYAGSGSRLSAMSCSACPSLCCCESSSPKQHARKGAAA